MTRPVLIEKNETFTSKIVVDLIEKKKFGFTFQNKDITGILFPKLF